MTTPNRVTEIVEEFKQLGVYVSDINYFEIEPILDYIKSVDDNGEEVSLDDWLRSKLTTLVAEAEARGRKMAVEYIQENSTGVVVGRTEDDVPILGHWILKPETLEAALTNHTV